MKSLDSRLTVHTEDRNIFQIIGWWELRRILYNLIILAAGLISFSIISILVYVKPGEDLQEPLALFVFGLLGNLGYTLGWLTEILGKKSVTYGPEMFKLGLYFTLFWVFLPAALHILVSIWSGFQGLF